MKEVDRNIYFFKNTYDFQSFNQQADTDVLTNGSDEYHDLTNKWFYQEQQFTVENELVKRYLIFIILGSILAGYLLFICGGVVSHFFFLPLFLQSS